MDLFTIVEDAHAVLLSKGVYRQAKVFKRGDKHFAAWGGGYIRLARDGMTTVPTVRWLALEGFEL